MVGFYERLLKECKENDLKGSALSMASRPDTPIMKLGEIEGKNSMVRGKNDGGTLVKTGM